MSFRKGKTESHEWQQWLGLHYRHLTLECGIPDEAISSRKSWSCLVHHGFFLEETNAPSFQVNELSVDQARNLYQFLLKHEPEGQDSYLFAALREEIGEM